MAPMPARLANPPVRLARAEAAVDRDPVRPKAKLKTPDTADRTPFKALPMPPREPVTPVTREKTIPTVALMAVKKVLVMQVVVVARLRRGESRRGSCSRMPKTAKTMARIPPSRF
jgi:hypothetical protein